MWFALIMVGVCAFCGSILWLCAERRSPPKAHDPGELSDKEAAEFIDRHW